MSLNLVSIRHKMGDFLTLADTLYPVPVLGYRLSCPRMISFSVFCIHVSCPLSSGILKKRCCKREESLKNKNLKNDVYFVFQMKQK